MIPIVKVEQGEEIRTHPAFGLVSVTHWTSNSAQRLFGSDLGHNSGITLKFSTAKQRRHLSLDWTYADETLLEVDLSPAQWAHFVSSSGMGEGTPVTITDRVFGEMREIPKISAPEKSKKEVHGDEMHKTLKSRLEGIKQITDRIGEVINSNMSKKELRELHKDLLRNIEQIPGNVQFIYDMFAEATEKVSEEAKTEVEAYVSNVTQRLGLNRLSDMVKLLEK